LQDKSEAKGIVKKFIRRVQNEFELKVKNIRSDNGSEFRNTQVEEFLDEEGIKHELSLHIHLNKMASLRGRTVH
jgi:hypothetical protein